MYRSDEVRRCGFKLIVGLEKNDLVNATGHPIVWSNMFQKKYIKHLDIFPFITSKLHGYKPFLNNKYSIYRTTNEGHSLFNSYTIHQY